VVLGGSLTLGVALLWSAIFPSLRRVDRMESIQAAAPGFAATDPGDRLKEPV
jgi:hypothetical protein